MCAEREAGTYSAKANYQTPIDTILHRHATNWHTAQNPTEKIVGLKTPEDHTKVLHRRMGTGNQLFCSLQLLLARGSWQLG